MIYLDSRYADGSLYKAWDARENKQEYHIAVGRQWPTYSSAYFIYEWIVTDRLDVLANKFLGNSEYWWRILDINPEIIDPLTITPGTQIRIPNA
jgi:hypothetical protein